MPNFNHNVVKYRQKKKSTEDNLSLVLIILQIIKIALEIFNSVP
jgi:hypothetical protein